MNKKSRGSRGFTLIELLVVIAIIGLLASVILASLNSARGKGADAAIKSQLKDLQSQAEIVYDDANPNSYAAVCTNANVEAQVKSAADASGATYPVFGTNSNGDSTHAVCNNATSYYVVMVPLKTNSTYGWCVDSDGASRQVTAANVTSALTACPVS